MKYNLAEHTYITISGNVGLTSYQVNDLLLDPTTTVTGLYSGDVLYIDCDLTQRTAVDSIRYYFDSPTASATVATEIQFQYKNNSPDSYTTITTNIGTDYYYATVSESPSAPRYIKLTHNVTSSGTLKSFYVVNDDALVDFGVDGLDTQKNVLTAYNSSETITVPLYNSGTSSVTMYSILESNNEEIDDLMSISDSETGTFYGPIVNALIAADEDNWTDGTLSSNVEVVSGTLVLKSSGGSYNTSGTYTSIINSVSGPIRKYYMKKDEPSDSMVTTNSDKYYHSIEVQESATKPIDFAYYTIWSYHGVDETYIRDIWNYDQSVKYTWQVHDRGGARSDLAYITVDQTSNLKGGTWGDDGDLGTFAQFTAFKIDGASVSNYKMNENSTSNSAMATTYPYWAELDSEGGLWLYFYSTYQKSGQFVDATGYYLIRMAPDFSGTTFEAFNTNELYESHIFAVDYDNDMLWTYSDANEKIDRLDTAGNIMFTYFDNVEDLLAMDSDRDGGLWLLTELKIRNINSVGTVLSEFDYEDEQYTDLKLSPDGDLWVLYGNYVKNLYVDTGLTNFEVYVVNASKLHPVKNGIYVESSDGKYYYIDTASRQLVFNYNKTSANDGVMGVDVGTDGFDSRFPTAKDTHWGALSWNEINYDKYILLESSNYSRTRITLRSSDDQLSTPVVHGIYLQGGVTINRIDASTSENIYLKVDAGTESYIGTYTPKLLTWREELL